MSRVEEPLPLWDRGFLFPGVPLVKYYYYALPQKLFKFLVDSGIGYGRLLSVMENIAPHIHTVSFVFASELFEELSRKTQNNLWDNCPHSFGDCGYSLVNHVHIQHWIEDVLDFDELSNEDRVVIEGIFETLKEYGKKHIVIDLEG